MLTSVLNGQNLSIAGELQVQYLDSLKDALDQALAYPQPLDVDLAGVSEADLAGLQLLLAFSQARREVGETRFIGVQPSLEKALALTGLDALLAGHLG